MHWMDDSAALKLLVKGKWEANPYLPLSLLLVILDCCQRSSRHLSILTPSFTFEEESIFYPCDLFVPKLWKKIINMNNR